MKKKLIGLLVAVLLLCALTVTASAESYTGSSDWTLSFTSGYKVESNFASSELADSISGLQPGDDITFTIDLSNGNSNTVLWYMTNTVLKSLEDGTVASGGAYTYILTYSGADGTTRELFNSATVGGEKEDDDLSGEGLHEIDSAMKDYFYLDTMSTGQNGSVTLRVALDGESQGNRYQNTLADLQMNFAVEVQQPNPGTSRRIVKTGDDMNLTPWYIAMGVSGTLFMLLAIDGLRHRKTGKEKQS